jgi:dipeptidyl aminopeptidase/acylaminoacyl peptidase
MIRYILLLISLVGYATARSQDGKILDQVPYTLPDSVLSVLEKTEPGIRNVNFFRITYLSDGLKVKGYLAIPAATGKYPCIIFNRGGNQEFAAITDLGFVRSLGRIAGSGYVIATSQYRGNMGGEGKEEFGGRDVNDVLNLLPLLSNLPQADTSRIGMFGWSRGGMMTYLALTRTNRIKAAVVGSGLSDLSKTLKSRPVFDSLWSTMIPGYDTAKEKMMRERSATHLVAQINKTTPILILQGTADWRVPTDQVLDLAAKFYETRQPFRFVLYEGGQHSLAEFRENYYRQLLDWFADYLRDGKTWPSLEPHGD